MKWYTFKIRYFDTSLNENREYSGEYKIYTNLNTSVERAIKCWLHDAALDMKQSNPYNLLWVLTNWNAEDEAYVKEHTKDEYWSGDKSESIHLDLSNEIDRIFFMTEADGKDDYDAYLLLQERGYLPKDFKGTDREKWAKEIAKKYGWEKKFYEDVE